MKLSATLVAIFLSIFINCSPPKEFMNGKPRHVIRGDTSTIVEYVETDVEVRQRSDFAQMLGVWDVATMRRQQKAELEKLSNVYFELKADSGFAGKGGCNSMSGKFSIKGSSIKFSSVISTKMACDNMDKENAFFQLLQNSVSEYTFNEKELLLRDGASNIIFECSRRE